MKVKEIFKDNKIYMIVLIITLLLSMVCVIKIVMPNETYQFSGEKIFDYNVGAGTAVVYENIALKPGVYEVELQYETDHELINWCTIEDGTVFTKGLLTNGEPLYTGLDNTGFRMWLFEKTDALKVCLNYSGVGYVATRNLTIRETNQLWSLCLVFIWSFMLLIGIIGFYKKYDKTVGIEKEKKTVFFWLAVIVLLASLPYLLGKVVSGADLTYHLQRIEGVADGIVSGQFPLRFEPDWVHGHGYANAVFYCNTLLYIPAILRLLGFTVMTSYNIFAIILNIATAVIAYYCFSRIFKSRYIGLMCSALYTLSIFRIYKLMITSAVGEGSAVTFMPLVLYGFYRVFTEDEKDEKYKTAWIPLAVGYAGLIQTHVLTCEITAFLTILVCLIFIKKIFRKETFLELAEGASAALAVSMWYLVPFLDYYMNEDMHIRHVSLRTIQKVGLYPAHLLFNWWRTGSNASAGEGGMYQSHPMGIGFVLVLAFIIFSIWWFVGKFKENSSKQIKLGKFATLMGGMLMLLSLNIFPWDMIQKINGLAASLVSSLQFPNRFLGWATTFLVAVAGCLLWYFSRKDRWSYWISVVTVILGIVTSSLFLINFLCLTDSYYYLYNEEGMGAGYISGAEYVVEGTDYNNLFYGDPVVSEGVVLLEYEKNYLHVDMKCSNLEATEGYVELPILCYTGYHAYADSVEELDVVKGNNNVIRVLIPEGFSGDIEVRFVSPWYWRLSEAITYLWWLLAAGICLKRRYNKKKLQEVDYV